MTPSRTISLSLRDIRKAYGARRVLSGITGDLVGGECLAAVGANGSGKSTLLKIIAGLLRPSRGEVHLTVDGATAQDPLDRRRWIGYCGPDLALYPELTGFENIRFFSDVRGESVPNAEIEGRLDAVGLAGRGKDEVSSYSSGMKQRLRLAFACRGGDVPLLLLDEPSLALDATGVRLVEEIILRRKIRGLPTLLATNDDREACWADRRISVEAPR